VPLVSPPTIAVHLASLIGTGIDFSRYQLIFAMTLSFAIVTMAGPAFPLRFQRVVGAVTMERRFVI
jgi:hypothetical protein